MSKPHANDNLSDDQLDGQDPANVQINEDGSITLGQSGVAPKGPAPLRYTGAGLKLRYAVVDGDGTAAMALPLHSGLEAAIDATGFSTALSASLRQ